MRWLYWFYSHFIAGTMAKFSQEFVILCAYFLPYLNKIMSTRIPVVYIDGFAGKGKFDDGTDGSPLLIKEKIYQLNPRQFFSLFRDDRAIRNIIEYYRARKSKNVKNRDLKELYKDVTVLYDAIYDNIDEIIKDYA